MVLIRRIMATKRPISSTNRAKKTKKQRKGSITPPPAPASSSESESESESESGSDSESSSPQPLQRKKERLHVASTPLSSARESSDNTEVEHPNTPIYVLLDQSRLETVKTRTGDFVLLNCDDHRDICRKNKLDPSDYRPDILHQELLALIDSPLNKSGNLRVYVKTTKNVLIEINPQIRIPRTFKRFSGLMVQLLHKMKIKANNESNVTLLKVVKNPFTIHLPPGIRVYGMSHLGEIYSPQSLANRLLQSERDGNGPVCLIIGAMAAGHITLEDHPYIQEMFSISNYQLSGAAAIGRIMSGMENFLGII